MTKYKISKLPYKEVQEVLSVLIRLPHKYYVSIPELATIGIIKDDGKFLNDFIEMYKKLFNKEIYKKKNELQIKE